MWKYQRVSNIPSGHIIIIHEPEMLGHFGMIPLINHDSSEVASDVVIICPFPPGEGSEARLKREATAHSKVPSVPQCQHKWRKGVPRTPNAKRRLAWCTMQGIKFVLVVYSLHDGSTICIPRVNTHEILRSVSAKLLYSWSQTRHAAEDPIWCIKNQSVMSNIHKLSG